jgi:hypothetical protein
MRVDVPTLRCDKCGFETQDIKEMSYFNKLQHSHMSGETVWDLCPKCWIEFRNFIEE